MSSRLMASESASYDVAHLHPGWSEQDPADWIAALDQVMLALRANVPQTALKVASPNGVPLGTW